MAVHSQSRRARRFTLAACLALLLALATSASASAAAGYGVSSYDAGSSGAGVSGFAYGTPAELPGPIRMTVIRAGSVVVDQTGDYSVFPVVAPTQAFSSADSTFNAQPGDTVQLFNPSTAPAPAKSVVIGRPTIDICPVGSASFTGKRDGVPGGVNSSDNAGAFRPSAQSGDPNRHNAGTITGAGDDYTTTLERPLATGDLVFFDSERQVANDLYVSRLIQRTAGTCVSTPAPVVPAPPVIAPPFNGILDPLTKKGVKQSSNQFVILVTIHCSALSKVPCVGNLFARTVKRFATTSAVNASAAAKKKVLQLARRSFSVAPGKTMVVKLKLTKQGQRLLKRQRKLAIRVSAVTRDAVTGLPRTTARTITLKAKKKSRKN